MAPLPCTTSKPSATTPPPMIAPGPRGACRPRRQPCWNWTQPCAPPRPRCRRPRAAQRRLQADRHGQGAQGRGGGRRADGRGREPERRDRDPGRDRKIRRRDLRTLLAALPNLPAEDVPEGEDETGNVEQRRWGEPFAIRNPKDHVDLGQGVGLMDFEAAARMSGSRFVVLKGQLARLNGRWGSSCWTSRPASMAIWKSRRRSWCATRRCSASASCPSSPKTCSAPPRGAG